MNNPMNKTNFAQGDDGKTLVVTRSYNHPVAEVWAAWTTQELLEQWWAPEPWKAKTKSFDFSEGGHWHYYMEGPEGERHYCWVDYLEIEPEKFFTAFDGFCDEHGNRNSKLPSNDWRNEFTQDGDTTHIKVTLTFKSAEDLQKIVEMGFKQGFSMGLDQLEVLLDK